MKVVKGDFEFKVEWVDGEMLYSAHYVVESEGVVQKRGMPVEFSPQEKTQVLNFVSNVVFPKVKEHEGIE